MDLNDDDANYASFNQTDLRSQNQNSGQTKGAKDFFNNALFNVNLSNCNIEPSTLANTKAPPTLQNSGLNSGLISGVETPIHFENF